MALQSHERKLALDLTGIDTLGEPYEAAAPSGVAIRTTLSADEEAMADIVAGLIKGQARFPER